MVSEQDTLPLDLPPSQTSSLYSLLRFSVAWAYPQLLSSSSEVSYIFSFAWLEERSWEIYLIWRAHQNQGRPFLLLVDFSFLYALSSAAARHPYAIAAVQKSAATRRLLCDLRTALPTSYGLSITARFLSSAAKPCCAYLSSSWLRTSSLLLMAI